MPHRAALRLVFTRNMACDIVVASQMRKSYGEILIQINEGDLCILN
jgi:hypothetical protein